MQVAQFIHGNRLEVLAQRLIDDVLAAADADPMRAWTVVVAHPALGDWLRQRIAERCGIAMHVECPLPSSHAWQCLRRMAPKLPEHSAFSIEALVWRIFAALSQRAGEPEFAAVARYLKDDADGRRRYELAAQLARNFDAIIMSRPDWVRAWSAGRLLLDDADEVWQARLWQQLCADADESDRARLMREVLGHIDAQALPADLVCGYFVFGTAYLPPLLREFHLAMAAHVPVRFYLPNPCLDYWGDIVSEREATRQRALLRRHGRSADEAHVEVGHPLLANWGQLGREFLKAIHEPDAVIHDDDAFAAPDQSSVLAWLQTGILLLDAEHAPPPPSDDSVCVHACPSRRREVEVVRDAILQALQDCPNLQPHDILVMSPRIEDYLPFIRSVFGDADDALAIPYSIGDVALRATHPLIDAFLRVLALGESRFAVSEVLGFVSEAAIARKFGLDGEGRDWLREWIESAAIRWGLDATHRAEFVHGQDAQTMDTDINTWRYGLNRLLLGYAQGSEEALIESVVPVANVEGSAALTLGGLARLLDRLARIRSEARTPRSVSKWREWLHTLLDDLIDTDTRDEGETRAIRDLRTSIGSFADEAERNLGETPLDFAVVGAALEAVMAEPPTRRARQFGITFCGMVPMRNVPHRMIALLGLDGGSFPRRQPVAGFNLLRRHPRPGDRTIREDDRFLFLESLIAARDRLHLSHVDVDAKGGSVNPPSVLVQELLDFIAERDGAEAWAARHPSLHRRHPAHAFSAPENENAQAWMQFDQRWMPAAQAAAQAWTQPQPFVGATPNDTPVLPQSLELDDLLAWLGKPAKTYFRSDLPLRMPEAEDDNDLESFALDGLMRYQTADRLLREKGTRASLERVQREGVFPLGPVGESGWEGLQDDLAELQRVAEVVLGGACTPVPPASHERSIAALGSSLAGTIRCLVHTERGERALLLRRPGSIRAVDLARLALERLLLVEAGEPMQAIAIGRESKVIKAYALGELEDAEAWLGELARWRERGRHWPLAVFAECAQAYAVSVLKSNDRAAALDAAQKTWDQESFSPSDDAYNALIARHREESLFDAGFEDYANAVIVPLFAVRSELKP